MLSTEDSEDQSEKKITKLQLILQSLKKEKAEQSMGKEEPAGGSMPIYKMLETKPPDGTAHESEQISPKPAGGSMQMGKMSEINLLS